MIVYQQDLRSLSNSELVEIITSLINLGYKFHKLALEGKISMDNSKYILWLNILVGKKQGRDLQIKSLYRRLDGHSRKPLTKFELIDNIEFLIAD